ncbi:MAG TPA: glycosyltransferase [Bacteroidia bacterium]|nr:glycosyltransferase [Sphingobacteriales bacterium]HPD65039.1 glycosyltransferase [Bacteroidia bacterium]HRS58087.1 glycosyltransferase [Bacteroidia bacterium]HRU66892.1 glycosyltransferase [Bacteroidia bacterium]
MSSDLHLNIVSFDIPYPPSYGGVIDVFYKIKALSEKGVKIHLHAFHYGRNKAEILNNLCEEVFYYPRKTFFNPLTSKKPYIVETRKNKNLLQNLVSNDYPILIEGIHCSYYLNRPELKHRTKILRMHNIEHIYYLHLAKVEQNWAKRFYFKFESNRLKKYLQQLNGATKIAAISPSDHILLNIKLKNSFYLPVFHPNNELISKEGRGDYILYHGNLGVGENNEAALFLVNQVFSQLELPFIIAGSNPSRKLIKSVKAYKHIQLLNPDTENIYLLIQNAQINILPTFQETGIKLKLLNALFRGRHCIVNSKMVKETGLGHLCHIADSPKEFISTIQELFHRPFAIQDKEFRKNELSQLFDNQKSAEILIHQLT